MEKPATVFTESRNIPVAIKRYVLWRDKGVCVICKSATKCQLDHVPEWALLNPKQHNPDWIFLKCKVCHSQKSKRDNTNIARAKRLGKSHDAFKQKIAVSDDVETPDAETKWRGPKLKSRGFPEDRPKTKWPKQSFRNRKREI